MNRYKIYFRPQALCVNEESRLWSFLKKCRGDDIQNAVASFERNNNSFDWKFEVVQPKTVYRIMASPIYNGNITLFPVFKNKVYSSSEEANKKCNQLRARNDEFTFTWTKEEIYDDVENSEVS